MEQDKQLKKILLKGSEIASANFTDDIMKRVNGLSTNTFYYQPLVSDKVKKAFVFLFAGLVLCILILCLMIGSAGIAFVSRIKIPQLSGHIYYKILAFILSFWVVFTINIFIEKNKLKLYSP